MCGGKNATAKTRTDPSFMTATHAAVLAHLFIATVFTLYVLARRREPSVMTSWILSFYLLPVIPNLLYMFFGYRRMRRARRRKPHPKAAPHETDEQIPGAVHVPVDMQSEARALAELVEGLT